MTGAISRLLSRSGSINAKFILPALTEATDPYWRPIQVFAFSSAGLATLAAYLSPDDRAVIADEHVEPLTLNDTPDLVVIQIYITNAYRAYKIADHYRSQAHLSARRTARHFAFPTRQRFMRMPSFLGPGEQTFPQFLKDLRAGVRSVFNASPKAVHFERVLQFVATHKRTYYLCKFDRRKRVDAHSIAISVTRTHSFKEAEAFIRRG